MIVLISVLYQGIRNLTQDYVISRLQHDADSLVAALHQNSEGLWSLPTERMSTVYNRVQSGHYYLVTVNTQTIRSRSLFDTDVELPGSAPDKNRCYPMDGPGGQRWMTCLQKLVKKGSTFTLWVAEDISPQEKALQGFMLFAVGAVIFTVIVLLLMQYHILQRGFSQLENAREAIRRMHLGKHDMFLDKLPIEISPLVDEIDRLLRQLSNRVQRSRNALGNLAHELKRPLQRYRSQLGALSIEQRIEGDAILQEINAIVERELKRARIVGVATPGRHTVIDDDLPHLVKIMQSLYPDKIIETNYAKNLVLPHDRDDILELLGNLLDNACKYAIRNISICVQRIDQGWQISIEDDGKGVTPNALKAISDRGVRLDENVHGHGLGLSICKDIVESYSGQMIFEAAKSGGLAAVVFFPDIEESYRYQCL